LLAILQAPSVRAAVFTVTTTNDTGAGSLRQAISDANADTNRDTILFAIAETNVPRIAPVSGLPSLTQPVVIDGTSQSPAGWIQVDGILVGGYGIIIAANDCSIRGLIIHRFNTYNVWIQGPPSLSNNVIRGCRIGTDISGTSTTSVRSYAGIYIAQAANTRIGGTNAGDGNLVSGNDFQISLSQCSGTKIEGNYIGTDWTGMSIVQTNYQLIANGGIFISGFSFNSNTVGGLSTAQRNIIAGQETAFMISSVAAPYGNRVSGNYFGLAADGVTVIGNGTGLRISGGTNLVIGGTEPGAGNVITGNRRMGIIIDGEHEQAVLGNSIYGNENVPIDIGGDGVTPNDPGDLDGGPNYGQNFPVLTAAYQGGLLISGVLNSSPNQTFRIEFFANRPNDCEAELFLGWTNVTTGADSNAPFSVMLPVAIPTNDLVSATATDPIGNTSEISACVPVTPAPDADGDSIADFWEQQYFGGPTNCTASGDDDEDGQSNEDEFFTGTNPLVSNEVFHCVNMDVASGVMVEFPSTSTRGYTLQCSTNPVSGAWVNLVVNQPGTNGSTTLLDTNSASEHRNYRVRVGMP